MNDENSAPEIEWPREIWMAELDEHHNGTGMVVLSVHATLPRWEGDDERDCEFQKYVDADIYDSANRYHEAKLGESRAEIDRLNSVLNAVMCDAAWTPKHPACEKIMQRIKELRADEAKP